MATKPQRAQQRLARALEAGVPATWVAEESVSGAHRPLRAGLEERPHASTCAVSGNAYVWRASRPWPVTTLLAMVEEDRWRRLQAGDGTTGPRWDDWQWLPLATPVPRGWWR